nr:MAG TPA: protein of unknown function (DUF4548) [Caudoviricetes sp.]
MGGCIAVITIYMLARKMYRLPILGTRKIHGLL